MNILAYGGGTDSTGIICGWLEKGLQESEPIEAIIFADTGGERPHTYAYIATMNEWLPAHGFPPITVVKKGGRDETLEEHCLRWKSLPSLAYGFKGCSQKFKIEPQVKFVNNWPPARAEWKAGGKVNKLIGFEFAERKRWERARREDEKYTYQYPLVEWEWSRPECQAAILRAGLPLPGKSACFFCPATRVHEIVELRDQNPDLFARAIAIEDAARPNLQSVKGLGRRFSWRDHETAEALDIPVCGACVDN